MDNDIEMVKERVGPILADFYKKSRENFIPGKSKSFLVALYSMRLIEFGKK